MRLAMRPHARAPSSWLANRAFLAVRFTGRIRFSTKLLSLSTRPSWRKTSNPSHWLARQASFAPGRDLGETRAEGVHQRLAPDILLDGMDPTRRPRQRSPRPVRPRQPIVAGMAVDLHRSPEALEKLLAMLAAAPRRILMDHPRRVRPGIGFRSMISGRSKQSMNAFGPRARQTTNSQLGM